MPAKSIPPSKKCGAGEIITYFYSTSPQPLPKSNSSAPTTSYSLRFPQIYFLDISHHVGVFIINHDVGLHRGGQVVDVRLRFGSNFLSTLRLVDSDETKEDVEEKSTVHVVPLFSFRLVPGFE